MRNSFVECLIYWFRLAKKFCQFLGLFGVFGRADDEFNRQFKRGFKGKGEPPVRILPMKQARKYEMRIQRGRERSIYDLTHEASMPI